MIKYKARKGSCLVENKQMYILDFDLSCFEEEIIDFYTDVIIYANDKEDLLDFVKLKKLIESYSPLNEYWDYD